MNKINRVYVCVLLLCAFAYAQAPAPYPITVNSQSPLIPALSVFQANRAAIQATFMDGTNAASISTNATCFMYWSTSPVASNVVTSTVARVSSNVFLCTFQPGDLNYSGGIRSAIYGVGVISNGIVGTYLQGAFTIRSDPYAAGAPPITWTTNINCASYNWLNAPWTNVMDMAARVMATNALAVATYASNAVLSVSVPPTNFAAGGVTNVFGSAASNNTADFDAAGAAAAAVSGYLSAGVGTHTIGSTYSLTNNGSFSVINVGKKNLYFTGSIAQFGNGSIVAQFGNSSLNAQFGNGSFNYFGENGTNVLQGTTYIGSIASGNLLQNYFANNTYYGATSNSVAALVAASNAWVTAAITNALGDRAYQNKGDPITASSVTATNLIPVNVVTGTITTAQTALAGWPVQWPAASITNATWLTSAATNAMLTSAVATNVSGLVTNIGSVVFVGTNQVASSGSVSATLGITTNISGGYATSAHLVYLRSNVVSVSRSITGILHDGSNITVTNGSPGNNYGIPGGTNLFYIQGVNPSTYNGIYQGLWYTNYTVLVSTQANNWVSGGTISRMIPIARVAGLTSTRFAQNCGTLKFFPMFMTSGQNANNSVYFYGPSYSTFSADAYTETTSGNSFSGYEWADSSTTAYWCVYAPASSYWGGYNRTSDPYDLLGIVDLNYVAGSNVTVTATQAY